MDRTSKIYVAGHTGLVGSAIVRCLRREGYQNLVVRDYPGLDLTRQESVEDFFRTEKPEFVFLAAAKVGGIYANNTFRADFLCVNLQIENNIICCAHQFGVKKLLFLGSSCIYPRDCPQPIKEDYLLSGKLEQTNEPYALAKIVGIKLCESYNRQYGTNFISCMPTNLYGPGDNYHPTDSHVIPGLIRRFHEAKISGAEKVVVWGSGKPQREFLFVDDLADACVFLMKHYTGNETINVGSGQEMTIKEIASVIKETVGFSGEVVFDASKPDGTPRKLLDSSKIHALGWKSKTLMREGLEKAYHEFVAQYKKV